MSLELHQLHPRFIQQTIHQVYQIVLLLHSSYHTVFLHITCISTYRAVVIAQELYPQLHFDRGPTHQGHHGTNQSSGRSRGRCPTSHNDVVFSTNPMFLAIPRTHQDTFSESHCRRYPTRNLRLRHLYLLRAPQHITSTIPTKRSRVFQVFLFTPAVHLRQLGHLLRRP